MQLALFLGSAVLAFLGIWALPLCDPTTASVRDPIAAITETSHSSQERTPRGQRRFRMPGPTQTADAESVVYAYRKKTAQDTQIESPRTTRFAVSFLHLHTLERLSVAEGDFPSAQRLAQFLRCRVTGDQVAMAVRPVEVAIALAQHFSSARIEVVSGYRSPKLNESLRKKGRNVAQQSLHMSGEAFDFRIPGASADAMAAAARRIHIGGIGTYRESNFVHIDIGANRRWRGD